MYWLRRMDSGPTLRYRRSTRVYTRSTRKWYQRQIFGQQGRKERPQVSPALRVSSSQEHPRADVRQPEARDAVQLSGLPMQGVSSRVEAGDVERAQRRLPACGRSSTPRACALLGSRRKAVCASWRASATWPSIKRSAARLDHNRE
jgi:hypothetical protein